jgi:hypothetical protein
VQAREHKARLAKEAQAASLASKRNIDTPATTIVVPPTF